jgi:hypothetical protein
MPVATPTHTDQISMFLVNFPLLSACTVSPRTLRAGSALVARIPSAKTTHKTRTKPPA